MPMFQSSHLRLISLVCLGLLLLPAAGESREDALTIWLMPSESLPQNPAEFLGAVAAVDASGKIVFSVDIEQFNMEVAELGVKVLNTTESPYRDQLLAGHPDYDIQNLELIAAQRRTLRLLGTFAQALGIEIQVLFVPWSTAFNDLRTLETRFPPDVAQVGNTWVESLAALERIASPGLQDLLIPPTLENLDQPDLSGDRDELLWRFSPELGGAASLKYLVDARLIFYWRHRTPGDAPFELRCGSWEEITSCLAEYLKSQPADAADYPMVFPIGLDLNLLHEYAMLAAAGGGQLIKGSRAKLTSADALRVPLLLTDATAAAQRQDRSRRLYSFPMMKHETATHHFMNGSYVAIIEPLAFVKRWHSAFSTKYPTRDFWDYAGIGMPPVSFLGGSDLIVLTGEEQEQLHAFRLARLLAADSESIEILLSEGQLPAQLMRASGGARKLGDVLRPLLSQLDIDEESLAQGRTPASVTELLRAAELAMGATETGSTPDFSQYEPSKKLATEIESFDVIVAIQRIWRAMARGDASAVAESAKLASDVIDLRINWWVRFFHRVWPFLRWILVLIAGLGTWVGIAQRKKANREAQIRKLRGLSAANIHLTESVHGIVTPPDIDRIRSDSRKQKVVMLDLALKRASGGIEEGAWNSEELRTVVWRSIMLALTLLWDTTLKPWSARDEDEIKMILRDTKGYLRDRRELSAKEPEFFFDVNVPDNYRVETPLLLEEALVCLLQNALKASKTTVPKGTYVDVIKYSAVDVTLRRDSNTLMISNSLCRSEQPNAELFKVINDSADLTMLAKKLQNIEKDNWPGIGLVEAFNIVKTFYGNLNLTVKDGQVHATISFKPRPK